ncbi:hypothetical protein Y032_0101g3424 [Ancylostoma ceylanicum]|uniref:Uncharacterized protein n=1 Tax=Ancylostoma ceylanicum TaxID=53326 RepID=A0A016THY9_9BILA|nr:hypothetical protein Y032_0101g3424 [Ancylostoma ceylanicum]
MNKAIHCQPARPPLCVRISRAGDASWPPARCRSGRFDLRRSISSSHPCTSPHLYRRYDVIRSPLSLLVNQCEPLQIERMSAVEERTAEKRPLNDKEDSNEVATKEPRLENGKTDVSRTRRVVSEVRDTE